MKPIWIWRSHSDITRAIGSRAITPISQSIGVRWERGGWLWQFPLAVEVENVDDGTQTRLPISDPTRTLVWLFSALTLAISIATIIILWQSRQRKRPERTTERTAG